MLINLKLTFLFSILLLFLSCKESIKKRMEEKRAKEVVQINTKNCIEKREESFTGVVDTIFLNQNYRFRLKFIDGRLIPLYSALEHSRHMLKRGDYIEKPKGRIEFVVKPYSNTLATYIIRSADGFDCDYWIEGKHK